MHELSIAANIMETVLEEMQKRQLGNVTRIGLKIGALSNVDPESLKFGFQTLIVDTPLAGCELEIEHVPIRARCRQCGTEFEADDFVFICPKCESSDNEVLSGQELDIVYLTAG